MKPFQFLGIITSLITTSFIVTTPSFADTTPALPSLDVHCATVRDSVRYGYCIHQVKGSVSHDVLYYLHSGGSSEYEWQNTSEVDRVYAAWGTAAPTVITVSYGSFWLLAEQNASSRSGLLDHFLQRVIPYLEAKLSFKPEHRMLAGASMGGFNAAELYLKAPKLFARVALLCPAISTVSPYAPPREIDDYIARTHANPGSVHQALTLLAAYFPDEASWSNAAPVALAQQNVGPSFPPVFVSVGSEDQYGFFEGAQAMVEAIRANGGSAQFSLVSGGHCSFDADAAIAFMVQPFEGP